MKFRPIGARWAITLLALVAVSVVGVLLRVFVVLVVAVVATALSLRLLGIRRGWGTAGCRLRLSGRIETRGAEGGAVGGHGVRGAGTRP